MIKINTIMMVQVPRVTVIVLILWALTLSASSQQMGEAERKSMEKGQVMYAGLKNQGAGVFDSSSNLPPEKMQSWEDMKFGMFIHWGLYSIPATGEWSMFNNKIPAEEYAKLADQFNPKHFDADAWATLAREAGMKYMVMVSRHHDGFAMWNSPGSYQHFNSWETAARRDFIKEYVEACRRAGLRVGLYYSPLDWRFPGYFDPKGLPDNAALLKKQTYDQVEELNRNYGKIDIMWYDGGWLAHKNHDVDAAWFWEPLKLNAMVRSYNPDIVINPRSGMRGDFQTNEGSAPVKGPIIPFPWEKCLNLTGHFSWGYFRTDQLMSLKEVVEMLVNVVDRGGNMLLNVGPDSDGVIPARHAERLKEVGQWLALNGESIYGTRPGPFQPVDGYYGSTHKGNTIYVHLVNLPENASEIKLPAIDQKLMSCKVLGGKKVNFSQDQNGIVLSVSAGILNETVTTFALETK